MFDGLKSRLGRSRHFNYGVPFVIFMVGSSFCFSILKQARYDYRGIQQVNQIDREKYGLLSEKEEEERLPSSVKAVKDNFLVSSHEELNRELTNFQEEASKKSSKDYEMIRGPRYYEPQTIIEHKKRMNKILGKQEEEEDE